MYGNHKISAFLSSYIKWDYFSLSALHIPCQLKPVVVSYFQFNYFQLSDFITNEIPPCPDYNISRSKHLALKSQY